jgi:hypothetical protein
MMIASYYYPGVQVGHYLDVILPELRELRAIHGEARLGTEMVQVARRMNLTCRFLRFGLSDLARLSLPCILSWDSGHFVVLARVGKSTATIHGPKAGVRKLAILDVLEHAYLPRRFSKPWEGSSAGIAAELTPASPSEIEIDLGLTQSRSWRRRVSSALLLSAWDLLTFASPPRPYPTTSAHEIIIAGWWLTGSAIRRSIDEVGSMIETQ